jgi:curved DNA-binding protein CbpA
MKAMYRWLVSERQVTVMAAADHSEPAPDLYQLLGVSREASRDEITQAWRRRARAEHPDAQPADADAPDRFRALAQAWRVLGDPRRRAAYDRALARERQPATPVTAAGANVKVRWLTRRGDGRSPVRVPGPPLRAGPVQVEGPGLKSSTGGRNEEDLMLAVLALRYLAAERGWPW